MDINFLVRWSQADFVIGLYLVKDGGVLLCQMELYLDVSFLPNIAVSACQKPLLLTILAAKPQSKWPQIKLPLAELCRQIFFHHGNKHSTLSGHCDFC